MTSPLAELDHISFSYREKSILQDVSLAVQPGSIVTIIGPNGSGKTTLVKILLGQVKPEKGKVKRQPGLSIGYVPQQFQVDPSIPVTVRAFIQLGFSGPAGEITTTLEKTGAGHLLDSPLQSLSGGEKQRVLLGRAVLKRPHLLILDEPVQGVDLVGQEILYALIDSLRKEIGCSVLMVSHDLNFVMAESDEVICLNRHICCSGSPDTVSSHPSYQEIFGDTLARSAPQHVTTYTHHHDHQHDIAGDISRDGKGCSHD